MKIYNKIVIDMASMQVLEEDSFEYDGPLALCGGGGSSGEIIYPEYMESIHHQWLNAMDTHFLDFAGGQSVTQAMNVAFGNSPYASVVYLPYNPDTRLNNMDTKWQYYYTMVDALVNDNPLSVDSPSERVVSAFTTRQNNEVTNVILPRFKAGMLDINAVQSSAFVFGQALIEMKKLETVADFTANAVMQNELNMRDSVRALTHMGVEIERLGIIAKAEYQTKRADQAAMNNLWSLEVFKYGCNVMSSIGAASVHTGQKSVSPGVSAMGGAVSGAAMGAQIGSSYPAVGTAIGAAVGAVFGGVAGYLSA